MHVVCTGVARRNTAVITYFSHTSYYKVLYSITCSFTFSLLSPLLSQKNIQMHVYRRPVYRTQHLTLPKSARVIQLTHGMHVRAEVRLETCSCVRAVE